MPSGYDAKIVGRSGLARDYGVVILGGEIDCGYTGEVIVIMGAFNDKPVPIKAGSRIAQLVVRKLYDGPIERITVEGLGNTGRGSNGFGSTGGF